MRVSLTKELISPKTISNFLPEIREMASEFCHLLRRNRDSENIVSNLEEMFDRLGLETSTKLALGRKMGFLSPENESNVAKELSHAVHENFIAMRDTYFGIPLWLLFSTPAYEKLTQSENSIYELTLNIIQEANINSKQSEIFQSIKKAEIDEREKITAIVDFIAAGMYYFYYVAILKQFLFKITIKEKHSQFQYTGCDKITLTVK